MRKVSAVIPVLIAGVVFSFVAIFFLVAQEDQPARRSLGEDGTTDQAAASAEVSTETPTVPEAPPAKGKNGSADGVVEITVAAKTGAPPESVETKGDSTGAAASASLITVAFDNVPVQDVVNMFAQISGANIIMAGSFTNMVITANLKNVEWKSALNLALGSVNLSMIEDPSGILMVVTSEMYPKKLQEIEATKPLVTRTIVPRYLNAVDLVEQIKLFKVLSPRGSITTSQSAKQDVINLKSAQTIDALIIQNPSITTAIVITDIKEYVDKVEALVLTLDKREPQVFIEARIINVATSDSKKLGFDWSMLDSFGVKAGLNDLTWNYTDSHSVDNTKENTFDQWDKRNNLDTLNMANGTDPTRTIKDTIDQKRDVTDKITDTVKDTVLQGKTATAFLDFSQVSLFLSALEKNDNAEMISHPQIVVGNRVEAKIHVGQKYPVLPTVKDQTTAAGSAPIITYSDGPQEIIDLGITLWVIPEIDFNRNTVRLTVRPQTATKNGEVKNDQTGKIYPIVLSRDIVTRVNVPSGHTVAIGGLVEDRTAKIESKVPVLGDIPLLGLLFRHTEDVVTKNNLIILITPTILDDSKPLTGLEAVAQLTIDKYEKIPLSAVKAVPSNTVAGVTIGTNAATPAAGMGRIPDAGRQMPDASLPAEALAKAGEPSSAVPVAPVPTATTPANP
ncbi:MAG: hypothetical protein KJ964_07155 [Verrucomicrobia bacterium]|nr:hypothetical protein [Verrucomicrobiota bacterium]MBU1735434.1 hypothetical protein [Verrucomicrobiota bacterium]MBU1856829.1 hypothetical protein [Verrucomicrobiota bacterium]